jgi:putative oxidoreductase
MYAAYSKIGHCGIHLEDNMWTHEIIRFPAPRPHLERGVQSNSFLGCRLNSAEGSLKTGPLVQRLFSTFPEGWPGTGLVFLRAFAAIAPVQHAIASLLIPLPPAQVTVQVAVACTAVMLLVGIWTPVAGIITALLEFGLAFAHPGGDPWRHILLGALGAALAMLGPGAWSVDARLYGRKRIQIPKR